MDFSLKIYVIVWKKNFSFSTFNLFLKHLKDIIGQEWYKDNPTKKFMGLIKRVSFMILIYDFY